MGDIWTALGEAFDRQAATQASIEAVVVKAAEEREAGGRGGKGGGEGGGKGGCSGGESEEESGCSGGEREEESGAGKEDGGREGG
jgi:hypothetical protein